MRKYPIDLSKATAALAEESRLLTDFQTKLPKVNEQGEPLASIKVLLTLPDEMCIIPVTVSMDHLPSEMKVNDKLSITGLMFEPWVNKTGAIVDRFSASSVELVSDTAQINTSATTATAASTSTTASASTATAAAPKTKAA